MRIHNIRLGFACNSSSSHSLIFLPGLEDNDINDGQFGWQMFTAASKESKALYFAVSVAENVRQLIGNNEYARVVAQALTGVDPRDGYIDHQSRPTFPCDYHERDKLDELFLRHYQEWLLQDGLAVLGGNDNGDNHALRSNAFLPNLPIESDANAFVCRYDDIYKFWTIYSTRTGAKFRLTLDTFGGVENVSVKRGRLEERTIDKASAPELVDIKLTDYCPFGCAYCYQDSTLSGRHASRETLYNALSGLAGLKVFEVAFGGGEPTLYPEFRDVLRHCGYLGITPNFTTRNLAWFNDATNLKVFNEYCGSFAFSADNVEAVKRLIQMIDQQSIASDKVTLQIIDGVVTYDELHQMIALLRQEASTRYMRITILGYKETGRGDQFKRVNTRWLDVVREAGLRSISIDTALAKQYQAELEALRIPREMYHTEEGKFSMYLDLVGLQAGASSYEPETFVKIGNTTYALGASEIRHVFSKW